MAERINEFDPAQRPRQLRRRAIVLAKLEGGKFADRWIPAARFAVIADDQGERVRDETELMAVLEHLVELRLIEEWTPMGMHRNAGGDARAPRRFRLTDRGYALWAQELDPIPSIADERLGD